MNKFLLRFRFMTHVRPSNCLVKVMVSEAVKESKSRKLQLDNLWRHTAQKCVTVDPGVLYSLCCAVVSAFNE